mgnify:CR=1 FL=1
MTYIRNEKKKEPDLTDEELDALANLGHTEESGNSRDLDEIEEKEEIERNKRKQKEIKRNRKKIQERRNSADWTRAIIRMWIIRACWRTP